MLIIVQVIKLVTCYFGHDGRAKFINEYTVLFYMWPFIDHPSTLGCQTGWRKPQ